MKNDVAIEVVEKWLVTHCVPLDFSRTLCCVVIMCKMLFGHFSLVRNVNCTMSKFFGVVVIAWFVCDIDAVYIFVRNGFVCVYSI